MRAGPVASARAMAERLFPALDAAVRLTLLDALSEAAAEVTRDLAPDSKVRVADESWAIEIGAAHKVMLVEGLDELSLALRLTDQVDAWEAADQERRPWAGAGESGHPPDGPPA